MFLFFLGLTAISYPQFSPFKYEIINVENGLSQSTIFSLLFDERNRLWLATADGLDIYDGYDISTLKSSDARYMNYLHNTITGLEKDTSGNVYIGTAEGLTVMNIRTHSLQSMIFPESGTKRHDGSIDYFFIDRSQTLWACGNDYLYTMDLKAFRNNPLTKLQIVNSIPGGGFYRVDQFSDGVIFVLAGRAYYLDPTTRKPITISKNPQALKILHNYTHPFEYAPDKLLLGLKSNEMYVFDRKKDAITTLKIIGDKSIEASPIASIKRFNDSIIVIASSRSGVYFFNQNSLLVTEAAFNKALGYAPITKIAVDQQHDIWIGTVGGGGLQKIHFIKPKFTKALNAEINPAITEGKFVKAIFKADKETLLLGYFNSGLVIYNRKEKRSLIRDSFVYQGENFKVGDVFSFIRLSESKFLVGTSLGILELANKTWELKPRLWKKDGSLFNVWNLNKIDNSLFAGTAAGLWLLNENPKLVLQFDTSASAIHTNSITLMFPYNKNELLLGTHWRGIQRYNTITGKTDDSLWQALSVVYPKVAKYIKAIYRDSRNNLWVAAQNALFKIYPTGKIHLFTEQTGLSNSFMYGILEDKNANIWVSTNKGLSRISPENSIRNYKLEDGLQSLEFNTGAFHIAEDGEMYFGGIAGINYFYPETVVDNTTTPRAFLTALTINNSAVSDSLVSSLLYTPLELPYNQNNISFTVSGMMYNYQQNINYSFFLEGFDNSWTKHGTNRTIRFTNLDPGRYTLKVKVSNEDGIWSTEQAICSIVISPPFWKTVWFISLAIALTIGSIALSIRIIIIRKYHRTLQKIREEQLVMRERERIARDLHDELGATLTSVSMRIQILQQSKDRQISEGALSSSIQHAIRKLDEIVWTVNPSNDDMQNLFGYITEFTQEFFESSSLSYRFDFPEDLPAIKLSSERRYNIFLIVKEALNNIQKYANATTVTIKAEKIEESIRIQIIDDGKGFDTAVVSFNSNGLKNMQKRAELGDAQVKLESNIGYGTSVIITFSIM